MIKVGIIGGGACGLMCAASLSKNRGFQVDIIEKESRVGKKILQTGNGRCNFTNMYVSAAHYNKPLFVGKLLSTYTPSLLRDEFFNLGLVNYQDSEGRCYPLSDSATSVLDVLRNACKINNVLEKVDHEVSEIIPCNGGYKVKCIYNKNEEVNYFYDYLVFCTGGNLSKLSFIDNLGIKYSKLKQSLCAIKANVSGLNGIRRDVKASLYINDVCEKIDKGEVLFKDGALSGIVMFNLSSHLARIDKYDKCFIELDLLPLQNAQLYDDMWDKRLKVLKQSTIELLLIGLFPKALAQYVLKQINIKIDKTVGDLTKKEIDALKYICKHLKFSVKENYASANYQVVSGGINLKEINDNFELVKYKNIYVGGELLDIDGECGGYNLHFAFSCGLKIANQIFKKNKK